MGIPSYNFIFPYKKKMLTLLPNVSVELEPNLELGIKILIFCMSTWWLLDYICDCKVPTFTGFTVLFVVIVALLVAFCLYKQILIS